MWMALISRTAPVFNISDHDHTFEKLDTTVHSALQRGLYKIQYHGELFRELEFKLKHRKNWDEEADGMAQT